MASEELLGVVDGQNRLVGHATRGEIHRKGLCHRAVAVWVIGLKGILLQQRSQTTEVCPEGWDLSTAGHVRWKESYKAAGLRELKEETGLRSTRLRQIRKPHLWHYIYPNGLIDNEMMLTYLCHGKGRTEKDEGELEKLSYDPVEHVGKWVERRPDDFTPWFLEEWGYLL